MTTTKQKATMIAYEERHTGANKRVLNGQRDNLNNRISQSINQYPWLHNDINKWLDM